MDLKRGLFRLWIVLSVLFVIAAGVFSYSSIRDEFHSAHADWDAVAVQSGGYVAVPISCDYVKSGTNFTFNDGLCWYSMKDFRSLYPEYNSISDDVLARKLYAKVGRSLLEFHPWRRLMLTLAVAFGVPLAVLILGASFVWAVAGFRRKPHVPQN